MKRFSAFRLISLLLIAAFVFVLAIGVFSVNAFYKSWMASIDGQLHQAQQKTTDQIVERIDSMETNISEIAVIAHSLEFSTKTEDSFSAYLARKQLFNYIQFVLKINPDLDALFVAKRSGEIYVKGYSAKLLTDERISFSNALTYGEILERSVGQWHIVSIADEWFLLRLYRYGQYTTGSITKMTNFRTAFYAIDQNSFCAIVSPDGKVLYTGGEDDDAMIRERIASGERCIETPLNGIDATLVYGIDSVALDDFMALNRVLLCIAAFLCASIVLVIMYLQRIYVREPVENIVDMTRRIVRGDYSYRLPTQNVSKDFVQLNIAINDMVEDICELRISEYENEIRLQSQELKLLRSQIRPHFYLNAVTMIKNLSYQGKNELIRRYLDYLANHLRYVFSFEEHFVPLSRELDVAANYIRMQQIRFPECIHFTIESEQGIEDTPLMHMTLLTIVENVFKHAMDLYTPLELSLHCSRFSDETGEWCRIETEDNGPGFTEAFLDSFCEDASETGGKVGLVNIRKSLELYYGYADLIRPENPPHGGARVTMLIPLKKRGLE